MSRRSRYREELTNLGTTTQNAHSPKAVGFDSTKDSNMITLWNNDKTKEQDMIVSILFGQSSVLQHQKEVGRNSLLNGKPMQ